MASDKQREVYGEGDLAEPVLWWEDIYMLDAAFAAAEKKLDDTGDGPRLPAPRDFGELARAE